MDARDATVDLQRTFVPPPELLRSRPRDVRLTAGGRALSIVSWLLFAVALTVGVGIYRESSRQAEQQRTFDRESASAVAEVTRLWRTSDDRWVAYRFGVEGREYSGKRKIRSSWWRTLQNGSSIDVRYLPGDPSQNVVAGAERGTLPMFLAFLLPAAIGAVGVLCQVLLNSQRRLLMEGRPAPALVTAVVTHKTSHGGSHRSITYTFPVLSGATAAGKSESPRKPPAVGSVICVVYDTERPTRSRIYPFPLVKV